MEDEVMHLQVLIEDLFTLARAEVGPFTFRLEPTDVGKLVRKIVETTAPAVWRMKKIDVVADVPSDLPDILVDSNRLKQVIQNLIHNAVRHTSPGGIVAVQVTVAAEVVFLHVKDTGEGIAPEKLPHIWERFYQAESAHTRVDNGAGLGLALVKELVEEMSGSVSVESIAGEGSCFTLRLPRAAEYSEEANLQRQSLNDQEMACESG
jgi:signal transduction histidine kinase